VKEPKKKSEMMSVQIEKYTIYGTSSLGAYIHTDEKVTLIPTDTPEKIDEAIKRVLKTKALRCSIARSSLLGIFIVSNSYGALIPSIVTDEELKYLQETFNELGYRLTVFNSKKTAIGNMILVNDRGAIISPLFSKKERVQIADTLNVEVVSMELANSPLVGAIAIATNRGALVHPLASDDELEILESVLHVKADVGTINRGSPYIKLGIIANSRGAIVGDETTGPELMRIHQVLFS